MAEQRPGGSRFLRTTGQHAEIQPDPFTEGGFVLSIGGAEQSHVNLADPADIFYEYLRRIGHVVDLAAPWGEPITALHLGAGALTLARYIQATRPGSVQYAVELERELLDFVLAQLPLPEGTQLHTVIGDARDALAGLPAELRFDVVILDIFSGPEAPEHHRVHGVLPGGRGAADAARGIDCQRGRRARADPGPEPGRGPAPGHGAACRRSRKPACSPAGTPGTSS